MWFIIMILHTLAAYVDTRAFARLKEKGIMPLYIMLMSLSSFGAAVATLGIILPSPTDLIRSLVLTIMGR